MASAPTFPFHQALLRPVVLQILRVTGYVAMKPSTLDAFTDIAVRYLESLCERLAENASNNDRLDPSTVDMRMALEDLTATMAQPAPAAHLTFEEEDARGMEEFLQWFMGPRNKTIRDYAAVDGDHENTPDYLSG
jgi:transcription initiation factor TFIID subunit 3